MGPQSHGSPIYGNFGTPTWESYLWEFRDSHLGVLGQNAIWMWASWRGIENTIRGWWWLPQLWTMVSLVNPNLPVAHLSIESAQTMH
jgi:hypothetical protein